MLSDVDITNLSDDTKRNMNNTRILSILLILLLNVHQTGSVPANKTIRLGYLVSYMSLAGAINTAIEKGQNDGLLQDYNFR